MKIFINGNVFTMDDALTKAEAFAVEEGRFVAVGSNEDLLKLKTDRSEVIDLAGKMTIPGLNDSHLHSNECWDGPRTGQPIRHDFASGLD